MELLNIYKAIVIIIAYAFYILYRDSKKITNQKTNPINVKEKANELYGIGNMFYKQHDYLTAISFYSEAIDLYNCSKYFNNRACAYWKMREFDKAEKDFNKAIDLNPEYNVAITNRGANYFSVNRKIKAVSDWENAVKMGNKRANDFLKKFKSQKNAWLKNSNTKNHNLYIDQHENNSTFKVNSLKEINYLFTEVIVYSNYSYYTIFLN